MTMDDETRKVIHGLRDSMNQIHIENMRANSKLETTIAVIATKVDSIQDSLSKEVVKQTEFLPVKQLAFGLVAFVLLAVLGTVIKVAIV